MATQPKRKSPDGATTRSSATRGRKPPPSRAVRMFMATAAAIGRHPRALGGLVVFGVIFSFVAANALWYQPRRHPAPFLATRADDGKSTARTDDQTHTSEPGVTVFRIERQSEEEAKQAAERAKPSELVRRIQAGLSARGLYDGPADGLTGPRTEAAILFFEQTEGMEETGEASEAILERLDAVAAAPAQSDADIQTASTSRTPEDEIAALIAADADMPAVAIPAEKPPSPALVMKIQKALSGMAYANVEIDGIPGEATRSAIRAFEKSYRLPVTGEPSQRVLDKLKSIGAI